MSENKTNMTQQQQMVRGAAWLTASNFISRLLGAFYIIPWYAWMGTHGEQANALFGMAIIFTPFSYSSQPREFLLPLLNRFRSIIR